MTEQLSQPDYVRAWAIAHNREAHTKDGLHYHMRGGVGERVPDLDSGDYFKAVVLAAESVCIHKSTGTRTFYEAWWNHTMGEGPDPVSALIAAVLAGGEK